MTTMVAVQVANGFRYCEVNEFIIDDVDFRYILDIVGSKSCFSLKRLKEIFRDSDCDKMYINNDSWDNSKYTILTKTNMEENIG